MSSLGPTLKNVDMPVVGNPSYPLLHYLDALSTNEPRILARSDERGGGEYIVRLQNSAKEMKLRLIISILQERCGSASCRIWRLLLLKQKLDEKQITKLALMNEKVVRTLLYAMFKIGLVFIQVLGSNPGCTQKS
jgi:hypothetical protein